MNENTESAVPACGDQWPKLAVKDFGPIAEGEVELRPLTVFAGPGNTGKSWLATLAYAMTQHVSAGDRSRGWESRSEWGETAPDSREFHNFPEHPMAWSQSLLEKGVLRLTDGEQRVLKLFLESGREALKKEILGCFGLAEAEVRDLVRQQSTEAASIHFVDAPGPGSLVTHRRLTITREGDFSLDAGVVTSEYPRSSEDPSGTSRDHIENLLVNIFVNSQGVDSNKGPGESSLCKWRFDLLGSVIGIHRTSLVHYLPADRGGLMHAHRAAVTESTRDGSRGTPDRQPTLPAVPGVRADVLQRLMGLGRLRSDDTPAGDPSSDLATRLEERVLGGRVEVRANAVGYPHLIYRPDEWKHALSFTNVSSMVSELAPVVLYLRHYVRSGDLLILEEPEAHLHPEMQVRLVREIAGWVRQGIRVLITTHSEWVLDGIANLVAAGEVAKEDSLKRAEVGMWLFENNGTQALGSSIREVEWSVARGGFSADYDVVARRLHNDWASLVGEIE